MMPGNMTKEIDPHSAEAQAGLHVPRLPCDGRSARRRRERFLPHRGCVPDPYLFPNAKGGLFAEVHDALIRSKPDVHRREMKARLLDERVLRDVPQGVARRARERLALARGQNEYDAHHDSGWREETTLGRSICLRKRSRAASCHMPLVDAPRGDLAAKNGKIRSHRFLGPNTALPHVRGDRAALDEAERFLKGSMRSMSPRFAPATERRPGGSGIDGGLLGGRNRWSSAWSSATSGSAIRSRQARPDSNEAWVRFTASDPATGRIVAESGDIDPTTAEIDPEAHRYRTLFVDEEGRDCLKREPHKFRAIAHRS
jgi:hypothetical protein